jgi:hypothetical protein
MPPQPRHGRAVDPQGDPDDGRARAVRVVVAVWRGGPLVDDGAAAGPRPGELDPDRVLGPGEQLRGDEADDRARVADRRVGPEPVALEVDEQPGQLGRPVAAGPARRDDLGRLRGALKTSRPYMKTGTPRSSAASRTTAAASGSWKTLNSADAVALPWAAAPPMKTIRRSPAAASG